MHKLWSPAVSRVHLEDSVLGEIILYPEHHLSNDKLHSLRTEFDNICDEAIEALECYCNTNHNRQSLLVAVDEILLRGKDSQYYNGDELILFVNQITTVPTWLDWSILRRGQLVFMSHAASASLAMLYGSLLPGFSAPHIVSVLDSSKYLVSSEYSTYKRLLETLEMVLDCMQVDSMRPFQKGWKSTIKVRVLHSNIRRKLLRNGFDTATNGVPINEEDMIVTQLSFSTVVLDSIRKIGSRLTLADEYAYLHLWRYIGYLIGIKEENNPCHSLTVARGVFESIVCFVVSPNDRSIQMARHLISTITTYSPTRWTYKRHCQMARVLIPCKLADAMSLDTYSLWDALCVWFVLLILRIYNYTRAQTILKAADSNSIDRINTTFRALVASHSARDIGVGAEGWGLCPYANFKSL